MRDGFHVLIISFGYPPLAHVSGTRASRMAGELAAQGMEVSVLTVDWSTPLPPHIRSIDESVAAALSEKSPRRVAVDGRLSYSQFDPKALPKSTEPPVRSRWRSKLRTATRIFTWGSYAGWARHAFEAACRVHAARPIHVIWAIHGDDSSHEIAYRLHRRFSIPWVADFKDPWNAFYTGLAQPFQRLATRRRLRSAAVVTETCAAQADADRKDFGRVTEVVYSGYNPDEMSEAPPRKLSGGLSIAYVGGIGLLHDAALLAAVFHELRRQKLLEEMGVYFHHFGHPSVALKELFAQTGCSENLHEHGWVQPNQAFSVMRGADVLILLLARKLVIGMKELEYFASGTPVLVLGKPLAETEAIIRQLPQVACAQNAEEGVRFLLRVYENRNLEDGAATRVPVNPPGLSGFTWQEQARHLSDVLSRAGRNA